MNRIPDVDTTRFGARVTSPLHAGHEPAGRAMKLYFASRFCARPTITENVKRMPATIDPRLPHVLLVFLICNVGVALRSSWSAETAAQREQIHTIENQEINESSGLTASRRQPGILWTHNDSGDQARLFALGTRGEHRGICSIPQASAVDWEDMCAITYRNRNCLLIADTGDNAKNRTRYQFYVVAEPSLEATQTPVLTRLDFQYEDGPHDCEAVAFDPIDHSVLLVTKELNLASSVYRVSWPQQPTSAVAVAKRIGQVPIPMVTGLDISTRGDRILVGTYAHALLYGRAPGKSWSEAFNEQPTRIEPPSRRQGESICFSPDATKIYLTSERLPAPLIIIRSPSILAVP